MVKFVDTTEWQEFRVGDLFDITKGSRLTKKDQVSGDIRFIGSSAVNNGVTGHVGNDGCIFEKDAITVAYNGSVGESFYQDEPFWASDDVNVLHRKDAYSFGAGHALFVATLMRYLGKRFGFTSKWNLKAMSDTIVKLPSKKVYLPNWRTLAESLSLSLDGEGGVDMSKIDTTGWQEFVVGELFEECSTTLSVVSKKNLTDGELAYVTRSAENNGVSGSCGNRERLNRGNCITIGAEGFVAFYQPDDFVAGNKVYALRDSHITEPIALYLCACLNTLADNYSFANARVLDAIKNETILLPSVSVDVPDWDYMERYMTQVMDEMRPVADELYSLDSKLKRHKLDTTEWKMFKVGELFEKCELKWHGDHEFNKALDVSDLPSDEFNLPLVNAKLGNNGIMFYGREAEWDSVEMSIDIVGDGASAVGSVYAQPQRTGVLYNAYLIKCKDVVDVETLHFLATVMESQIKQHFSYDNKCTWNKVKLLSVVLPATLDGTPDWDTMAEMMRGYTDSVREVAEVLAELG